MSGIHPLPTTPGIMLLLVSIWFSLVEIQQRFIIARGRSPEAISGSKEGIASAPTMRLAMTRQRLNSAVVHWPKSGGSSFSWPSLYA